MAEFYNGQFVMNKNKPWNFLMGNRNGGKSFFFKMLCIKTFLKGMEEKNPRCLFALFHRKVDDVKLTSPGFFDDVMELKYPEKTIVFKPSTNGFGRFYLDGVFRTIPSLAARARFQNAVFLRQAGMQRVHAGV